MLIYKIEASNSELKDSRLELKILKSNSNLGSETEEVRRLCTILNFWVQN